MFTTPPTDRGPPCSPPDPTAYFRPLSPAFSTEVAIEITRPFMCPEPRCRMRFKRKFTLAEHRMTHTGERPFRCCVETCGRTFVTSGNLARHRRVHPWLKPQSCLIDGCRRSFSNEIQLERHMEKHFQAPLGRQPCPVVGCDKTFTTSGNLTRHLKHQHADTPHDLVVSQRSLAASYVAAKAKKRKEVSWFEGSADHNVSVQSPPRCGRRQDYRLGYSPLDGENSDISDDELLRFLKDLVSS